MELFTVDVYVGGKIVTSIQLSADSEQDAIKRAVSGFKCEVKKDL